MKSKPQHRLPQTAVRAWRISGFLVSLFFWIGPIAMWFFDSQRVVDLWIYLLIASILIPVNRVQHVDTRQGPILRNYALSNVTISTAATTHEIPALTEENAGKVRDQISRLALKAKEDV